MTFTDNLCLLLLEMLAFITALLVLDLLVRFACHFRRPVRPMATRKPQHQGHNNDND